MTHAQRLTTALLALLLLLTPTVVAEDKQVVKPYEAWFVLNIGGQKAGHMHVTLKQVGDKVLPGHFIATSNNSGTTTGPHLHISVKTEQGTGPATSSNTVDPEEVYDDC